MRLLGRFENGRKVRIGFSDRGLRNDFFVYRARFRRRGKVVTKFIKIEACLVDFRPQALRGLIAGSFRDMGITEIQKAWA